MVGLGLGLRPRPGLKLGPRLGSVEGVGLGEEQQMTGQGWVEHRSKVRSAGAGAERVGPVVPEETRGCVSRTGQHSSPPRTHAPLPVLPTPNPPPARTQQQRGLRAQHPSGHGGLSELSGPKALAGPAGEGWAELRGWASLGWESQRSGRDARRWTGKAERRQQGEGLVQTRTMGTWPRSPQGAGAGAGPEDRK